jgi:hypothetical protein
VKRARRTTAAVLAAAAVAMCLMGAKGCGTGYVPASYNRSYRAERHYARAVFGIHGSEMRCLVALWDQESGWNPDAVNPHSGAYGIPRRFPQHTAIRMPWATGRRRSAGASGTSPAATATPAPHGTTSKPTTGTEPGGGGRSPRVLCWPMTRCPDHHRGAGRAARAPPAGTPAANLTDQLATPRRPSRLRSRGVSGRLATSPGTP